MVLSNKRLKRRLRAESFRQQGNIPPPLNKSKPTNKREKKRQRRELVETSSAQQRDSPDTPVIAQAELDVYHRCIETLLCKDNSVPSSDQGQDQEGIEPRTSSHQQRGKDAEVGNSEQNVANEDGSSTPNSWKRRKKLERNARREKQDEEITDQGQAQSIMVNNEYVASNGGNPSLPVPSSMSRNHKKDSELQSNTDNPNEEDPDCSAENQDSIDTRKVYVGGIPYYSSEDDIRAFFSDCGTICEVHVKTFSDTGKFRGIALLTFKTVGAAKRALALDGASMGDRFLKIQPSTGKPKEPVKKEVYEAPPVKTDGYLRAYVGNLSWSVTEEDIRDFFQGCKIDKVKFSEDKVTGEFRGFGHVDFMDDDSLERALQLNQEILLERPIKVAYAVPNRAEKRVNAAPARERKEISCHTCGEKGHVSSRCPYMGKA